MSEAGLRHVYFRAMMFNFSMPLLLASIFFSTTEENVSRCDFFPVQVNETPFKLGSLQLFRFIAKQLNVL
jgi:hypothetical protein